MQIPLYNEVYVARRVIQAVSRLSYPKDKFEIQILDDSTDETSRIAQDEMEKIKQTGISIYYYHRKVRSSFKAGALKKGLSRAKGELIAIFDADFLPDKDFLLKTVAYFKDPKVGIVQTRWAYLNSRKSIITQAQKILLDAHFQIEHTARAFSNRFMNFNGTAGLLRVSAIMEAGNWEGDTLTEDLDISYRMQLKGYRIAYLPYVECMSELPEDIMSLKNQQFRWTKGSIQVAKKLLIPIMASKFPLKIKIEAFMHLCAPLAYLVSLSISTLMPIFLLSGGITKNMIGAPEFITSFFMILSLSIYYFYAQKELNKGWSRDLVYLPSLFSMGVTLCVSNSWAIWQALWSKKNMFTRTPKYSQIDKKDAVLSTKRKKYISTKNYALLGIEVLYALFLNISFYTLIKNEDWLRLPLFLILLLGFNYNLYLTFFQK